MSDFDSVRSLFKEWVSGSEAPLTLYVAVSRMIDPADVKESYVERESRDDSTRWAGVWVTDSQFVYAEASKDQADWKLSTESDQSHSSCTGWVRPLEDVESMGIDGVEISPAFGAQFNARVRWRLVLTGGASLTLPTLGGFPAVASERHLDRLLALLGGQGAVS